MQWYFAWEEITTRTTEYYSQGQILSVLLAPPPLIVTVIFNFPASLIWANKDWIAFYLRKTEYVIPDMVNHQLDSQYSC